jgi:hypothetical protein
VIDLLCCAFAARHQRAGTTTLSDKPLKVRLFALFASTPAWDDGYLM